MSSGITFTNIIDAQDYQRMMYEQGFTTKLVQIGMNKYKIFLIGERKQQETGAINPAAGESLSSWHFSGSNMPEAKDITDKILRQNAQKMPDRNTRFAMSLYGLPYDIDKEIRKAILDLNRQGFITAGSCAGHNPETTGFITLKGNLNKGEREKVKAILTKNSLEVTNIDSSAYKNLFTGVNFKPAGIKTTSKKRALCIKGGLN